MSNKLSLEDYTKALNILEKKRVDRINAEPDNLFGAMYFTIREEQASYYYARGYNVLDAFELLTTPDNTPL